jgi:predicted DCC family thiol-disulfide oxidoreductase YuxK
MKKTEPRTGLEAEREVRPLLIYDGDCGYCTRWISRWRKWTEGRVIYAPTCEAASAYPRIPAERFKESVVLVEPDGRVSFGAEAVARSLAVRAPGQVLLWIYERVPGAGGLAEAAYRFVARRRGRWPFV